MQKLHFSIVINAPRGKVWHAMLDDRPYREWTKAFGEGGYYKGSWAKGSKILFLGLDPKTGKEAGMVSRIADNRPYEFISIEHLGIVQNGVKDTTSAEAKKWVPAYENYTLKEQNGVTEVLVDMDTADELAEEFKKMWPDGLNRLKTIAETQMENTITVQTVIKAPMSKVWEYWNAPEHIERWAFASDDWEAYDAENDVRVGGKFKTVMAAKDKSASFDFSGIYTVVKEHELIEYDMDGQDQRHVRVEFAQTPDGVKVTETFDPENENSEELQRSGWQAILDNFKKYVESSK